MNSYIILREAKDDDGAQYYQYSSKVYSDLSKVRQAASLMSLQYNVTLCVAQLLYRNTIKTYTEEERLNDGALEYRGTVKAEEEHVDDGAL